MFSSSVSVQVLQCYTFEPPVTCDSYSNDNHKTEFIIKMLK